MLNYLNSLMREFADVGSFGNESPNQLVGVLIGAAFPSTIWVSIIKKELNDKFTSKEIISCLRNLMFLELPREGYMPVYERTDLTDALHTAFGFSTDNEFLSLSYLRKIFRFTKSNETLCNF